MKSALRYLLLGVMPVWAFAQKPLNPPKPAGPQSIVEVLNSDIQEGVNLTNMQVQTFTGNVIFRHQGVLMGTDKAIQNTGTNIMEAFGNIRINQGDTLTIVGDTLYYEGNTRIATIWGKSVVLRDKKVTLRTKKVIYNMANGMAYYPVPGQIMQDSSRLSSNTGYYNTNTKYFNYIGDVEVMHPKFVVCTDSMDYDTHTKKAIFKTFTTIRGENGNMTAERGWYNIQTKESYFSGRSRVDNEKYVLMGDTLNYDSEKDFGWARGNVVFVSKTDSLITVGDEGIRVGSQGITKINGSTITQYISQNQAALIAGDSLRIIEKPKVAANSAQVAGDSLHTIEEPEMVADSTQKAGDSLLTIEKPKVSTDSISITGDPLRSIAPPKVATDSTLITGDSLSATRKAKGVAVPTPITGDSLLTARATADSATVTSNTIASNTAGRVSDTLQNTPRREPSREDVQYLIATGNVKVYRTDMQSISDSLIYNALDSTVGYYKEPVLWHRRNQIKADSIDVFLKNNRINRMEMVRNCFIIEQDSLLNFNQIKGRNINAYFTDSSRLEQIHIYGNAESKYFILDEKNKIVGLDLSQCSSMKFIFLNDELEDIYFYGDVDSRLVPPGEITQAESRFEDFNYRISEKPTRESILALKHGKLLESSAENFMSKKEESEKLKAATEQVDEKL